MRVCGVVGRAEGTEKKQINRMISKQKVSLLVLVPLCHCVSQDLGKRGS